MYDGNTPINIIYNECNNNIVELEKTAQEEQEIDGKDPAVVIGNFI